MILPFSISDTRKRHISVKASATFWLDGDELEVQFRLFSLSGVKLHRASPNTEWWAIPPETIHKVPDSSYKRFWITLSGCKETSEVNRKVVSFFQSSEKNKVEMCSLDWEFQDRTGEKKAIIVGTGRFHNQFALEGFFL